MAEWRKLLLLGLGWGLGTAVGLALLVGGFLWYQGRPRPTEPPKPWNTTAIKAEYDTTDFDYRVGSSDQILMNATLMKQKNLTPFTETEKIDYPIIVPAKKRMRFLIHISYTCPAKQKEGADLEERRKHGRDVEKYVSDELTNLDGFDFLDETKRYEIVFPAGWKQSK